MLKSKRSALFGPPGTKRLNWLGVGSHCWQIEPYLAGWISGMLSVLVKLSRRRISARRWARYTIRPADVTPLSTQPQLTPVTDYFIKQLRNHPDSSQNQVQSGIRWWEHGLRRAYVWMGEDGPLCMQWLLTEADNAKLRSLPEWAGMCPPLSANCGQVENLFAFSNGKQPGIGIRFFYSMYEEERRLGLREIVTHIVEDNVTACRLSERTGWRRYGTLTRYEFDFPVLRGCSICLHVVGQADTKRFRSHQSASCSLSKTAWAHEGNSSSKPTLFLCSRGPKPGIPKR